MQMHYLIWKYYGGTMEVLRNIFALYDLPEQIVTDNGPQFTATDFADFKKVNGIGHIRSAPTIRPQTAGQRDWYNLSSKL